MVKRKNQGFASSVKILLFLLTLVSISSSAYAHEVEASASNLFQFNPTLILTLSGVVILSILIMSFQYSTSMDDAQKKIFFASIVLVALISTGYLIANTLYLTFASWSKGLVHWHADYEIWVCGERLEIPKPTGLSNKIGTDELHQHGDDRIHVEGVILNREDATLGHFFAETSTPEMRENFSVLEFKNCPNHKVTSEKMYVNGDLYTGDIADYVISPYPGVPPGDVIKIVFE